MYEKFPTGPRAERAAWKYGWAGYRNGDYAETVRVFESRGARLPALGLPSAVSVLGRAGAREARCRAAGRVAPAARLHRLRELLLRPARRAAASATRRGPAAADVRLAVHETPAPRQPRRCSRFPPRRSSGCSSPTGCTTMRSASCGTRSAPGAPRRAIEATIAWVYHQKGELRRAITLMRRAYPQFLTAGGAELPAEILQVIFPLTYWDAIRQHSALARSRSVPRRRADRAGVDVRRRHPVGRRTRGG